MALDKLIETQNPGELALIKSLLDGNGFEFYVQNEHLGGLYNIAVLPCVVMVDESDLGRAQTLLSLLKTQPERKEGRVIECGERFDQNLNSSSQS